MPIRYPWDLYDVDDKPGHRDRLGIRVYPTTADQLLGRPATLLLIHGTSDDLLSVVDAIIADGWEALCCLEPEPCQPAHRCWHVAVLHAGHADPTDVAAAL